MRFSYHLKLTVALLLSVFSGIAAFSQTDSAGMKHLNAVRVASPPKIDGKLDDAAWQGVPIATDFTQINPSPGDKSAARTEVKVIYDDDAVYVGAMMYDSAPDSILKQFSQRDEDANTAMFVVALDTYDDNLNAFLFQVSAAGVQVDGRESPDDIDMSWNAVWDSKVQIVPEGWIVEYKIPYAALRFPKTSVQTWGVNFVRRIRRIREESSWNTMNPAVDGLVNQYGELNGIEGIKAPVRLAFFPYLSAYLEHYPYDDAALSNTSTSLNGGMDVKYGINDAFTVDMTLVPDFGQVQSDNQVLNLSPFEVQFNENRQFFTEGTEIFNKSGLFYSRRIGGTPIGFYDAYSQLDTNETVVRNPEQSQLINATKLSGRTSSGLGIGIFNGVTREISATIENTEGQEREVITDPLTNYNVFVLDQNLKNNSFVTFVNTNVMRAGSFYDANVTASQIRLVDKGNRFEVAGGGVVTQKYDSSLEKPELGHSYNVSFEKISGKFGYGAWHAVESDRYDPNDLGFLFNNNSSDFGAFARYNIYEPFGRFNSLWSGLRTYYSRLFNPNQFQDFNINGDVGVLWKNFLATGMRFTLEPIETYDFFEARVEGRYYTWSPSVNVGGFYSSDYRKKVALDVNLGMRDFQRGDRFFHEIEVSPRFRVNDRLMIIPRINRTVQMADEGVALGNNGPTILGDTVIFAIRDQVTWTSVIQTSYIFTNQMGLTFRLRHYWSSLDYQSFHVLSEDGYLDDLGDHNMDDNFNRDEYNRNFNAFNIDMVYSWVFAPGSNLSVVWKSSLLTSENQLEPAYFDNLKNTLQSPQLNSFSIKILYYLDYQYLRRAQR